MCELIGRAIEQAIQRRRLLGGAGATVLAAVLGQPASAAEIAQQEARLAQAKSAAAPLAHVYFFSAPRGARLIGRISIGAAPHPLLSSAMRFIWLIAGMASASGFRNRWNRRINARR